LIFKDTKFTNNSCQDGCLAHSDGVKGIISERVVATDNYAYETAALFYVERNISLGVLSGPVDITYSLFSRNYASRGMAGLIY
jgi:hypothetical protein